MKTLTIVALFSLLFTSVALAAPALNKAAPTFSLRDRQGALIALGDLAYSGKAKARRPKQVVLLDFFRTDCKPCHKGLAKLIGLHKKYKGKGVTVYLVALLEDDGGEGKLNAFLKKNPLPFPVLVDAYGVVGKKYVKSGNGFSIPALFVIDKDGVLRAHVQGLNKTAANKLDPLLARLAKK